MEWRGVGGVGRLDMLHMCTESQLVLHPLAGWFRRSLLEGVKEREIVLPDVRLRLYFTLILIQLYLGFWGFGMKVTSSAEKPAASDMVVDKLN